MIRNVLPRFLMKHNVYSYDGKNEGEPTTTTMYQRFYSIFMHNPNGRLSTFYNPSAAILAAGNLKTASFTHTPVTVMFEMFTFISTYIVSAVYIAFYSNIINQSSSLCK